MFKKISIVQNDFYSRGYQSRVSLSYTVRRRG